MTEPDAAALLDARLRVGKLAAAGRELTVEADQTARDAVAALLGILAVDQLSAALHAVPFRGGLHVTGQLDADVRQQCVVTLEPVSEHIEEPVDRVFLPGRRPADGTVSGQAIFVDPEGEDEPDWFDGEYLDLAPLLIETLALALDPFPRAPGAVLDGDPAPRDDADASPFAVLAQLRDRNRRR